MREPTYMESDQAAMAVSTSSAPPPDVNKMKLAKKNLKSLYKIWPFLKNYWKEMAFAVVSLFISSAAVLSVGPIMRTMIDEGFATGHAYKLDKALLFMIVVIVLVAVGTFGRFYFISWVGERVVADMRKKIYYHLLKLSPSFYETAQTGDLISRMNADTSLIQVVVGSAVSIALRNLVLFIGGTVMMMVVSVKMGVLVLSALPFVIVPIIFLGNWVKNLSRETQIRLSEVGSGLEETITGIRTIQAFSREEIIKRHFNEKVENAFGKSMERVRIRAMMIVTVIMLVLGAISFAIWRGGQDVISSHMTSGELSSFIFYSLIVAGAAGAISEIFGDLQRAAGACDRIFELLAVEPEIKAPPNPRKMPVPGYGEIEFENVSFFYPSRPANPAVDSMTLHVKPAEKLAIVGPSGAGKSTLFQLLLRFYEPQLGTIRVDNYNIKEVDPRLLRQNMSLVPQEVMLFSTDAMTNIRIARPDATDEEVKAAAEAANADEFISQLPQGYQTFLGEKGVRLSVGQKQRIGIARALLRNAPIVLLDEATSALDSANEKAIRKGMAELMKNRTVVIIAHRLSTIQNCDRIVVMDKGQIVETGTHDELVAKEGLYAKLSRMQLKA